MNVSDQRSKRLRGLMGSSSATAISGSTISAMKQISGQKIRATFRYFASILLAIPIVSTAGGIWASAFDSRGMRRVP